MDSLTKIEGIGHLVDIFSRVVSMNLYHWDLYTAYIQMGNNVYIPDTSLMKSITPIARLIPETKK